MMSDRPTTSKGVIQILLFQLTSAVQETTVCLKFYFHIPVVVQIAYGTFNLINLYVLYGQYTCI